MATRLPIGGLRFGARRSRRRTAPRRTPGAPRASRARLREPRSEEHTSELQSRLHLVCRLLLKKKKNYGAVFHHIDYEDRHIDAVYNCLKHFLADLEVDFYGDYVSEDMIARHATLVALHTHTER